MLGYLIWSWFTWPHGRTPGMRALRLRVVERDAAPAGRRTMAIREMGGKGVALLLGIGTFGVALALAAAPVLLPGRRAAWDRWPARG